MPTLSLAAYPTNCAPRCHAPFVSGPLLTSQIGGGLSSLTRTVAPKRCRPTASDRTESVGFVEQPTAAWHEAWIETRRTPCARFHVELKPGQAVVVRHAACGSFGRQPESMVESVKNPTCHARSSRWIAYCALNRSMVAPAGASNAIVAPANSCAVPALTRLVTRMPPEAWWRVGQV